MKYGIQSRFGCYMHDMPNDVPKELIMMVRIISKHPSLQVQERISKFLKYLDARPFSCSQPDTSSERTIVISAGFALYGAVNLLTSHSECSMGTVIKDHLCQSQANIEWWIEFLGQKCIFPDRGTLDHILYYTVLDALFYSAIQSIRGGSQHRWDLWAASKSYINGQILSSRWFDPVAEAPLNRVSILHDLRYNDSTIWVRWFDEHPSDVTAALLQRFRRPIRSLLENPSVLAEDITFMHLLFDSCPNIRQILLDEKIIARMGKLFIASITEKKTAESLGHQCMAFVCSAIVQDTDAVRHLSKLLASGDFLRAIHGSISTTWLDDCPVTVVLMLKSVLPKYLVHLDIMRNVDMAFQDLGDVFGDGLAFWTWQDFAGIVARYRPLMIQSKKMCYNPSCGTNDDDIHYQLCAGCQSVRYCSKACQQAGWRTHGHRNVCKRMQASAPELISSISIKAEQRCFLIECARQVLRREKEDIIKSWKTNKDDAPVLTVDFTVYPSMASAERPASVNFERLEKDSSDTMVFAKIAWGSKPSHIYLGDLRSHPTSHSQDPLKSLAQSLQEGLFVY